MTDLTRDGLIKIGERFASEEVLSQYEYHVDLLKRDAAGLAENGFPLPWAAKMDAKAAELRKLLSSRTLGRGGKQAKRADEGKLVRRGKDWIRRAAAILKNAAESPEDPKPELGKAAAPLLNPVGGDAQAVSSRVDAILALLKDEKWKAALSPFLAAKSDLLPAGAALADALPGAKGAKKGAQAQAVVDTADLDALDGTLWVYFKAANRAGRAYWLAKQDRSRAAEYNLDLLNRAPNAPKRPPSIAAAEAKGK